MTSQAISDLLKFKIHSDALCVNQVFITEMYEYISCVYSNMFLCIDITMTPFL